MSKQLDFEAYLASAILSPDGIASESARGATCGRWRHRVRSQSHM